jgi:hypothetical protein
MNNSKITADLIIELLKANIEPLRDLDLSADDSLIASGLVESLVFIWFF